MREVYVVAVDATEASVPALSMALALAEASGASVLCVHVVETPGEVARWSAPLFKSARTTYQKLLEKQTQTARRKIEKQIAAVARRPADVEVTIAVRSGAVADTILQVARSRETVLLVLGKGREPGAIAAKTERIARAARRPVLIVPGVWSARPRPGIPLPAASRRRPPRARAAARRARA